MNSVVMCVRLKFWTNVYSLRLKSGEDYMLSSSKAEFKTLVQGGAWEEVCSPLNFPGSIDFCHKESTPESESGSDGSLASFVAYTHTPPHATDIHTIGLPAGKKRDLVNINRCKENRGDGAFNLRHFLTNSGDCGGPDKLELVCLSVSLYL
jgi:hypothetical protein